MDAGKHDADGAVVVGDACLRLFSPAVDGRVGMPMPVYMVRVLRGGDFGDSDIRRLMGRNYLLASRLVTDER